MTPDKPSKAPNKTRHDRPGRPSLTLVGTHLYEVTATTSDGQTAKAVIAADGEPEARTGLMLVQTTMRMRGQKVTFVVRQLNGDARMDGPMKKRVTTVQITLNVVHDEGLAPIDVADLAANDAADALTWTDNSELRQTTEGVKTPIVLVAAKVLASRTYEEPTS